MDQNTKNKLLSIASAAGDLRKQITELTTNRDFADVDIWGDTYRCGALCQALVSASSAMLDLHARATALITEAEAQGVREV